VFDVYAYGEIKDAAVVLGGRGYLARVKGLVQSLRGVVRGVYRRVYPEVRGKEDECLINLRGFIQYMAKNGMKLGLTRHRKTILKLRQT
jgi:hypothetical protein